MIIEQLLFIVGSFLISESEIIIVEGILRITVNIPNIVLLHDVIRDPLVKRDHALLEWVLLAQEFLLDEPFPGFRGEKVAVYSILRKVVRLHSFVVEFYGKVALF